MRRGPPPGRPDPLRDRFPIRRLKRRLGRPAQAPPAGDGYPRGTPEEDRRIVDAAMPYSMTGRRRLLALVDAVRYCVARDLPGAFAECGVWRGGSVLAMVLTLQEQGVDDRDIFLYDTFEGMTEPTEKDTSPVDRAALEHWQQAERDGRPAFPEFFADTSAFNEGVVRDTILASGYPSERVHLVRGPVEETLPGRAPEGLALLRLDTDWYESTRHELEHLYPRLTAGGVLIVDDYGHWEGSKLAVDEYFAGRPLLMTRIDYAARMAVKH